MKKITFVAMFSALFQADCMNVNEQICDENMKQVCSLMRRDYKEIEELDLTKCEIITVCGVKMIRKYFGKQTHVRIPNDISVLRFYAFSDSNVEVVVIPASVTSIWSYSFSNCRNLKVVEFERGSQLRAIDSDVFRFSQNLEAVINIPNSVESIGNRCFFGCRNLSEITFEERSNVKSVGRYAFVATPIDIDVSSLLNCLWICSL